MNILQLHKKAFLDLLDADNVAPPLVWLDGGPVPPGQALFYVVVYFAFRTPSGVDEPEKVSLEATSDVLITTAYCNSVGGNQHASLAVAGRVRAAVRGITPVISGRVCAPIGHVDGAPTQRDETTGTAVFNTIDEWQFASLPG